MNSEKTHIYFVPGMAAGSEIFRNIKFPETYEVHILEWLIPEKNESLKAYAERMARRIQEKNPILIGVSFGGVVAQEMSDFLELKKLIIISSVKSRDELPRRMKLASLT
ncbi:MAG: alpha/beta hydrolase, partial [Aequorivita vladivostokensis]|nr:alpha/beta hydrolase [Aequorivita vladivostokensis]